MTNTLTSAVAVVGQCVENLASGENVESHQEDIVEDEHDGSSFSGDTIASSKL